MAKENHSDYSTSIKERKVKSSCKFLAVKPESPTVLKGASLLK